MQNRVFLCVMIPTGTACRKAPQRSEEAPAPPAVSGSVRAHVRLNGTAHENDTIRMNADPMCAKANGGRPVRDEPVIAAADGGLANAFVELVGTFPDMPVPIEPVTIDQRACTYRPRVVGLRVGQTLKVRNSDDGSRCSAVAAHPGRRSATPDLPGRRGARTRMARDFGRPVRRIPHRAPPTEPVRRLK
jgi:hypothetical protein